MKELLTIWGFFFGWGIVDVFKGNVKSALICGFVCIFILGLREVIKHVKDSTKDFDEIQRLKKEREKSIDKAIAPV